MAALRLEVISLCT